MEEELIKKIFESSEGDLKTIEGKKDVKTMARNFPVLDDDEVGVLAESLSKLLSFKVSPDIHQRYSARIQVIELIREWVRPPLGLDDHAAFLQDTQMLEFTHDLLKKYLTPEILQDSNTSPDNLIKLGKLLFSLSKKNPNYIPQLKTIIQSLTLIKKQHPEKDELVGAVLNNKTELSLEPQLIDELYISISEKVLETPLIDNFLLNYEKLKNKEELLNSEEFDQVISLISLSAKLFQKASSILKELFLYCNHSTLVVDYIQFVLKNILSRRDEKTSVLELYPAHLQSCVALLRIDPRLPRDQSKQYVLDLLSNAYWKNKDEVLILMLHYPGWINELAEHLKDIV